MKQAYNWHFLPHVDGQVSLNGIKKRKFIKPHRFGSQIMWELKLLKYLLNKSQYVNTEIIREHQKSQTHVFVIFVLSWYLQTWKYETCLEMSFLVSCKTSSSIFVYVYSRSFVISPEYIEFRSQAQQWTEPISFMSRSLSIEMKHLLTLSESLELLILPVCTKEAGQVEEEPSG